jgi:tryptophan synthase alpha subunit
MSGIDRLARAFEGPGIKLMAHAVCGYPDRSASSRILRAMASSGADIIEAQLPFSDPSADGRAIVEANHAALRSGSRTSSCLESLEEMRRATEAPILIMSYLNPILAYGPEDLVERAARSGIDGFIVPDCPDDEHEPDLRGLCRRSGLAFVPLIAPATSLERARELAETSLSPFLYVVTRLGVTGRRTDLDARGLERLTRLREATGRFTAAGFGIRERAQVEALEGSADCAIVGSALVDAARGAAESGGDPAAAVGKLVRALKGA